MHMRNFLYIALITLLPYQAYAMKREHNIAAHNPLPPLAEPYTPETLLITIQKHIAVPDPIAVNSLLSTLIATKLSQDQKKLLYEHALEAAKAINQQIIHTNVELEILSQSSQPTSSSQEDLSAYSAQHKNLLKIIKVLYAFQLLPTFKFPQALFTPQPYNRLIDKRPNLDETLKALIANEQEKIYICCFHLTLRSLADSLVNAKNNGVSIEIITDQAQLSKYIDLGAIKTLKNNEISILTPQNHRFEQMHHKFFIFKKNILNKSFVWTGSYNPTTHGNDHSWDDVVIIDNPTIVEEYIKRFEEIKSRSK